MRERGKGRGGETWRGKTDLMTFNSQNRKIFNLFKMSKCIFKNIKHYLKKYIDF